MRTLLLCLALSLVVFVANCASASDLAAHPSSCADRSSAHTTPALT